MMVLIKIYGKVVRKNTGKVEYFIITDKQPIKVKSRGRWWIYFGTFGFQMSAFRFDEYKETLWYEVKHPYNCPRDCLGYGWYKVGKKMLEDFLK